ncbi:MAG: hypothetical protein WEC14_11550, partial [Chloroflexota bacterium]
MADDTGPTPERRPRRRRTPKAAPPEVAPVESVVEAEATPVPDGSIPAEATSESVTEVAEVGEVTEVAEVAGPDAGEAAHETFLPVLDDRSPNEWVCPFLRAVDDDDRISAPVEAPDAANRCAALREPVPQSLRQQELVCLTSGHVNCPRYLRGAVAVAGPPEPVIRTGRTLSPAILGSAAVLAFAFVASATFVIANGGLELNAAATATPRATEIAVVVTASPTVAP